MLSTWWRALSKRNARFARPFSPKPRPKFFRHVYVERLEDRTLPSTFQWVGGSSANWNDAANWKLLSGSGTFPNAKGDVAQFTASYSAAQGVTLNQTITVGEIDFGSSKNVTITSAGGSVLTLDDTGAGSNAILDVGDANSNTGTDLIAAPISVATATPLV